ncbi:MAG: hypothetical protein CMJ81_02875 [Planctomycetaceae bacterium]|nr:hypothetical protein [Planctomycetaceae bacterium]MBP60769.1 hypothetical protein [Planctomycetaceae bacterium]
MSATTEVVPLVMPDFGNSMEEGVILDWKVQVGETIRVGDVLCEVETDKAVMEYEAPHGGRLARIVAHANTVVPVREVIAYLAESDEALEAVLQTETEAVASPQSPPDSPSSAPPATTTPPAVPSAVSQRSPQSHGADRRLKISPAARMVASQRGIDVSNLEPGSGPHGRILSSDVPPPVSPDQAAEITTSPSPTFSHLEMTHMQGTPASEPRGAWQSSTPQLSLQMTIDAAPLLAKCREQERECGCTLTDLIVLASGQTLMEFPALRSQLQQNSLIQLPQANVGIAVEGNEKYLTPVISGVNRLSLPQLVTETKRVISQAKVGEQFDTSARLLTIFDLGMFGVEKFSAVITPPETAILTVGTVREKIVVDHGSMRPAQVMTMTLSVNHQIVNGFVAARFLSSLRKKLTASPCIDFE